MQLRNKTVPLTGASGGIGSALAHKRADRGAHLHLVGRNRSHLARLSNELDGNSHIHAHDLATSTGRLGLQRSIASQNICIDILINNAGISDFALFEEMEETRLEDIVQANLVSPMLVTRKLLPCLNTNFPKSSTWDPRSARLATRDFLLIARPSLDFADSVKPWPERIPRVGGSHVNGSIPDLSSVFVW